MEEENKSHDRVYDGWCLYPAIRREGELAGAADLRRFVPEAAALQLPYWSPGKADPDCPYPILACGEPDAPKFRFGRDIPHHHAVRLLLQLLKEFETLNQNPVRG